MLVMFSCVLLIQMRAMCIMLPVVQYVIFAASVSYGTT